MEKKAILYSLDNKITLKQLRDLDENNIKLDFETEKKFINYCKKNKIKAILGNQFNWKKTKSAPYISYYMGEIEEINKKMIIGIVGPRKTSNFISKYLEKFFNFISNINDEVIIISGLAEGTDLLAHKLAIKNKIKTCAVLGYGIAKALNSKQRNLIDQIIKNKGIIISEFKLKQEGTKWTFPQRNRIIAGLSDILFVPQGKENSGTLITINNAIKSKVPVYSCFSECDDKNGIGTNKLIKENKINGIYNFEDFLSELENKYFKKSINRKNIQLSEIENEIIKQIKEGNKTLENIQEKVNIPIDKLLEVLSELELKEIINDNLGEYELK